MFAPEVDDLARGRAASARTRRPRRRARRAVDRPRILGPRRRAGERRDVVDPAAVVEDVARVRVVRLPERARVGRDRVAADLHLVPHDPRRDARARPCRRTSAHAPSPCARPGRSARRRRRRARAGGGRAARCRGSPARDDAGQPRRSGSDRRSYGRERAAARGRRATSPSSISRFRWTSCQTTYGWSVAMQRGDEADTRRREAASRSRRRSSAVATATTICAIPTASHERPNGK